MGGRLSRTAATQTSGSVTNIASALVPAPASDAAPPAFPAYLLSRPTSWPACSASVACGAGTGIGTTGGGVWMSLNLRLRPSGVPAEADGGEGYERNGLRCGGLGAAGAATAWGLAAGAVAAGVVAAGYVAAGVAAAAAVPTPLSSSTRCLFCTMNHLIA